jgi:hypothetical protein
VNVTDNCVDIFSVGARVPKDTTHSDGWDYADATHTVIQLFGAACAAAQTAPSPALIVVYPCCGIA